MELLRSWVGHLQATPAATPETPLRSRSRSHPAVSPSRNAKKQQQVNDQNAGVGGDAKRTRRTVPQQRAQRIDRTGQRIDVRGHARPTRHAV
jgi:hypothetical protein